MGGVVVAGLGGVRVVVNEADAEHGQEQGVSTKGLRGRKVQDCGEELGGMAR